MKEIRISVLGIGTELTQGQIANTNGQWISRALEKWGVKCSSHLVVPDHRELVLEALKWCETHSDFIFVTGGLGPTSDDFTRELISEYFEKPLEWHEPSWLHVQSYLKKRGIEVLEVQKQQAFYPQSSLVLENRIGTAHGFHLTARNKEIFVFPGPPREIEGIWQEYLNPWLDKNLAHIDAYQTLSWDCIGAGESEIAARTEAALGKHDFEIGYRVHLPYVEVKLTFKKSQTPFARNASQKMDQALADFVVLQSGEDAAELLCKKFENHKVRIEALTAAPQLATRLQKFWHSSLSSNNLNFQTYAEPRAAHLVTNETCLRLEPSASSGVKASLTQNEKNFSEEFQSRYSQALMQERQLQFYAEKAILFWLKKLE